MKLSVIALDYDGTNSTRRPTVWSLRARARQSLFRGAGTAIVVMCFAAAVSPEGRTSRRVVGGTGTYEVSSGDTWQAIGARFGIDTRTLAADNGLTVSEPLHAGQRILVDNRHIVPDAVVRSPIVVNVPQRMLFLSGRDGLIAAFPAAVGRANWRTPLGRFTVLTRERDPSWEVPQSILEEARRAGKSLPPVVPPGPDNPLGQLWLGLSLGSVGIHGTNAPTTIYRVATHGCIRLHPDDIAELFDRVEVGTSGEVIYEPILLTVEGEDILLEAHPDAYHRAPGPPLTEVTRRAALLGIVDRLDMTAVERVLKARDGIARSVAASGR